MTRNVDVVEEKMNLVTKFYFYFVRKEYELGEITEYFNCTRVCVGQWLYEPYIVYTS
jgi:hypothetical protein